MLDIADTMVPPGRSDRTQNGPSRPRPRAPLGSSEMASGVAPYGVARYRHGPRMRRVESIAHAVHRADGGDASLRRRLAMCVRNVGVSCAWLGPQTCCSSD